MSPVKNSGLKFSSLLIVVIFSGLSLTACGNPTPTPNNQVATMPSPGAGAGQPVPRFEAAKCPYQLPENQQEGQTVRCGYVVVPELHAQPVAGRFLKLAVIIFKTPNSNPSPEPLVYLEGGPGGHIQDVVGGFKGNFYRTFTAQNDVVFYDQRGVGLSQPALHCQEVDDEAVQDAPLSLSAQEATDRSVAAITQCHDRLIGQGINLNAYNSAESSADLNDIRRVLGYQKLNLYAGSYGTFLALTTMRLFPTMLRSVVLDSVLPPDINDPLRTQVNGSRSLKLLFATCQADPSCNQAYPDLQQVFKGIIEKLNSQPATVKVTNPFNHQAFDEKADGSTFLSALYQTLYNASAWPQVPQIIYAISKGDYSLMSRMLAAQLGVLAHIDVGMYYSVRCSDEYGFSKLADINATNRDILPEWKVTSEIEARGNLTICQHWNVAKADASLRVPLQSDLPTLLLSGYFDPTTPPEYAQRVVAGLSQGYYVEFPFSAHGIININYNCGLLLLHTFVNSPSTKPDTSCVATQPKFIFMPPK